MRPQQRRRRTREQPRRLRAPFDRKGTATARQRQPRQRRRTKIGSEIAVPDFPVTTSRQLGGQRLFEPAHCRDHTALRRCHVHGDVKPVRFGYRVEQQRQRVAPGIGADRCGSRRDLRAPIGDSDLSRQPGDLPLTGDGGVKNETVNAQRADVDIEIGQQRLARIGHDLECGHLAHRHRRGGRRADIDMICEIAEWAPIDPDLRRLQEHTLGIGQSEVADDHLAIKRPVEPPDANLHPVFEFIFLDLGNNEAPPGIAVEPDQEQREQQDQPQQRQADPAQDRHGPIARLCTHRGIDRHGRVISHQNACPIET